MRPIYAFTSYAAIIYPDIVILSENKIRHEQLIFDVEITKILQGHDIEAKATSYWRLEKCIARLDNLFDSCEIDEF